MKNYVYIGTRETLDNDKEKEKKKKKVKLTLHA